MAGPRPDLDIEHPEDPKKLLEEAEANKQNLAEKAKRKHEQELWESHNNLIARWPRSGWKNRSDLKAGDEDIHSDVARLRGAGETKVKKWTAGVHTYETSDPNADKPNFNLLVTKDNDGMWFKPIPVQKTSLNRDAYQGTLEAIGGPNIEIDLPFPSYTAKEFNKEQILMLIKTAHNLGFAISRPLNQSTNEAIATFSAKDQRMIFDKLDELEENKLKVQMMLEAEDDKGLKGADSLLDAERKIDKVIEGKGLDDVKREEQFKNEAYLKQGPLTEENKLAAMEGELSRLDSELDKVIEKRTQLESRLTAQENLLRKPEELAEAHELKAVKNAGNREVVKKQKQRYQDVENAVDDVNKRYVKDAPQREKMLETLEEKLSSIEKQRAVWVAELEKLKTKINPKKEELEGKKARFNKDKEAIKEDDPAKKDKMDKIDKQMKALEEEAKPVEDKIKSLEKQIAAVDKLKDKAGKERDAYDQLKEKNDNMPVMIQNAEEKVKERKGLRKL